MIVSFHPIIEADENIICAGRVPGKQDLEAIRNARAVILSQGCSEALYRMARQNCPHVFPNLDVRFDFPGKCGQIQLFGKMGLASPPTTCFESLEAYEASDRQTAYPAVVKMDWGGEGDTVFKVENDQDLSAVLTRVQAFESSGQFGFLIQQFIPSGQRALRVALIGRHLTIYWRNQPAADRFGTSIAGGACIDHESDPELQRAAGERVMEFSKKSGLDLAGIDFIFDELQTDAAEAQPLALEINYFFGREGLGGSASYYRILEHEVAAWLRRLPTGR